MSIQDDKRLDMIRSVVLEDAHGEDIVRSLFVDDQVSSRNLLRHCSKSSDDAQTGVIFTAGEDGHIKAFGPASSENASSSTTKASKAQRTTKDRYKPY